MALRSHETSTFLWAHVGLLCIVLIGFGRTFYLRGLFLSHPLPLELLMHGSALTFWYAIVVLQGWLVATGRRTWHARVAWLAIPAVVCVLVSGVRVNMNVALQITSARSPENMFVWGNFMSLLSFLVLVTAGVIMRRRLAVHYRLMFFASLAIVGPAFARFAFWPAIGMGLAAAPIFAIAGMVLLLLIAVGYDLARFRRVQPATLGGLAGVITPLVAGTALAISGAGYGLLH